MDLPIFDNFEITNIEKNEIKSILYKNIILSEFGITVSEQEAKELIAIRNEALKINGRIEFRHDIVEKLIFAFCDSRCINNEDFVERVGEFVDMFYYFRNETNVSDDEIISAMRMTFDKYNGSDEMVESRTLDMICGGNENE